MNPGATEICNGIDDDCDGLTDDADPSITGQGTYFTDADGDNFGTGSPILACVQPIGTALVDGDCNDANAAINPAAAELCNGIDDNCNGLTDDGVAPLPTPGTIVGTAAACLPATFGSTTFSVAPVAGATGYTWSVPAGFTILAGQGSTTITVQWTNVAIHNGISGNMCVTAVGTCSSSLPSCVYVQYHIAAPVMPNSISGPSKVCPGDVATYSVAAVARATTYNWTLPAGMTITSGTGTNVINVLVNGAYTGGTLSVSGTNVCGTGAARTKAMSLNMPLTPGVIAGQRFGLCNSTGVVFSIPAVANATSYLWTISGGTIVSGQGTTAISVDVATLTGTGTLNVVAVNNCGSSSVRSTTFFGIPDRAQPITGTATPCANTIEPYSVATVAGASLYTWSVSTGGAIVTGQGSKNITVQWSAAPITGQSLSVFTSNACGVSTTRSLTAINVVACPRIGEGSEALGLTVYPNPATTYAQVQFNAPAAGNAQLRITDVSGRVVYIGQQTCVAGTNTVNVDLSVIATGLYMVSLELNGEQQLSRLIVE